MLIPRTLSAPIAAAAVLVGLLFSAPAFAQAHIRGTVTDVKDGTIGVQNAKGERYRSNSPATLAFSW
jgi:hypothetical protein